MPFVRGPISVVVTFALMSNVMWEVLPLDHARCWRCEVVLELSLEAPTACFIVSAVLIWLFLVVPLLLLWYRFPVACRLPWFVDAAFCLGFLVSLVSFLFAPCLVVYLVLRVFLVLCFHQF